MFVEGKGKYGAGKKILIDESDFEKVSENSWNVDDAGYAHRYTMEDGKMKKIYLHRQLFDFPKDKLIDHINGDRLDNRRQNLRPVTHQQNSVNSRPRKNTSSKYKGVSFDKRSKKWCAYYGKNRKKYYIGSFECEKAAARAYNEVVRVEYEGYGYLNVIEED